MKLNLKNVEKHEKELTKFLIDKLKEINGVSLIGVNDPELKTGVVSFGVDKVNVHEVALMLDESSNIMIRSGTHCVHSWFNAHNLEGSARASLYLYNTKEEVEFFVEELKKLVKVLK